MSRNVLHHNYSLYVMSMIIFGLSCLVPITLLSYMHTFIDNKFVCKQYYKYSNILLKNCIYLYNIHSSITDDS